MVDGYWTIASDGVDEFTEKRSRFIGYSFYVERVEEAQSHILALEKQNYDATHNCYAYIIGENGEHVKFSDAGEPQGTAGMPMLGVLQAKNLTNTLVVVVRYYGGIHLGAAGLVRAYTRGASIAVDAAGILQVRRAKVFEMICSYPNWGKAEGILRQYDAQFQADYAEQVRVEAAVDYAVAEAFAQSMVEGTNGQVQPRITGERYRSKRMDA